MYAYLRSSNLDFTLANPQPETRRDCAINTAVWLTSRSGDSRVETKR